LDLLQQRSHVPGFHAGLSAPLGPCAGTAASLGGIEASMVGASIVCPLRLWRGVVALYGFGYGPAIEAA
jgi:hypothetical protein